MGPLVEDDWASELLGTWAYGKPEPSKYQISRTQAGRLKISERLPTGVKVTGTLELQGRHYQAALCTVDGKKLGSIRVRFDEVRRAAVSNVRGPGSSVWGQDIVAEKDLTARRPVVRRERALHLQKCSDLEIKAGEVDEAAQAAERLSKFFDTMGCIPVPDAASTKGRRIATPKPNALEAPNSDDAPAARPPGRGLVAPGDTVATAGGHPLAPFGYLVNRLEFSREAAGMVCAEATAAGTPLLVLPLTSCWTAWTAKAESPILETALSEAAARNSQSKLLQSSTTWLALHLMQESHSGARGRAQRSAHLALLPETFETLLAWSARDIESLHGSRWKEAAKQRQAQVTTDYRALAADLGPEVVERLGLDEAGYRWARHVIQAYALHFRAPDGSTLELLAPGLELLAPDTEVAPKTDVLRVEYGLDPAPALVLYAGRDLQPGDRVDLEHAGLACSSGYRLLGCGLLLEANPMDSVELLLKLPVVRENVAPSARFWQILEALEEALKAGRPKAKAGDCLPLEVAEGQNAVKVVEGRRGPEVRVQVQLSSASPLPGRAALGILGVVILADSGRLEKIMLEEKGLANVLGQDACERRAVMYLSKRIRWALEEIPSRCAADAAKLLQGHTTGPPPRRARGARLVVSERKILEKAEEAAKEHLATPPTPEEEKALLQLPGEPAGGLPALVSELLALEPGQEPAPGSELAAQLAQVRGCTRALEKVAVRFRSLLSDRQLDDAAGKPLKDELTVLGQLLAGSPLGPLQADLPPGAQRAVDVAVRACGEAFSAAMNASLANAEWEAASAERARDEDRLERVLQEGARTRMRQLDFSGALADLKRCLQLKPATPEDKTSPMYLAGQCAQAIAARSEAVLGAADAWKGCGPALRGLREKMQKVGYMKAGLRWPQPKRLPPVESLALSFEAEWAPVMAMAAEAARSGRLPSKSGPAEAAEPWWWFAEGLTTDLRLFIHLFVLRRTLSLAAVKELLGKDACKLLLERSALSCYMTNQAELLEASAAVKLVEEPEKGDEVPDVFANVSLYPVDEDVLVAVDFDQRAMEGSFEPVAYCAEDTQALIVAAPRRSSAKEVLDLCCGSGAHGLVALRHYAKKATFLDSNPRALRFAAFSAVLNGVEESASFHRGSITDGLPKGKEGPFDAVLAGLPHLPHPDGVGSSTGLGGADAEQALAALLNKAPALLAPGGWLTATATIADASTAGKRMERYVDVGGGRGCEATLFRSTPVPVDTFVGLVTAGCNEVQKICYARGMSNQALVRSVSQVVVLLWSRPSSQRAARVEVKPERAELLQDMSYLQVAVPRLLDALLIGVGEDEPLYSLDWAELKFHPDPADGAPLIAASAAGALAQQRPPAARDHVASKSASALKASRGIEGATWVDFAAGAIYGFSLPALCDVFWQETAGSLKETLTATQAALPEVYRATPPHLPVHMALLELQGGLIPGPLFEACSASGLSDKLTLQGDRMQIHKDFFKNVMAGGIQGGIGLGSPATVLSPYDVVLVPLIGWYGRDMLEVPCEVLKILRLAREAAAKRTKPLRLVLLTCGSMGPSYTEETFGEVPAAGSALGVIRCARAEVPQVPLLCIDSDALLESGSGDELAAQLRFEVDHSTPREAHHLLGLAERAKVLLAGNREVAYRAGKRYLLRVDLSPRGPIYAGRQVPPLPAATAAGAIVITGGTGGLGLVAAEALVEVGAENLVLTSRTGNVPPGQGFDRRIEALRDSGATVIVEKCDTSSEKEVAELLERVRGPFRSITAVVHSSGLSEDKPLAEQDAASMRHVFQPKAYGAWHLHRQTSEDGLHAFLLFSSSTALRGGAGQANLASANAYLDDLARLRRSEGLPAISVQWPLVDFTGRAKPSKDALESTIGVGTVKQVVKQMFCGWEKVEPVQAVLPEAHLTPSTPMIRSLLEPLTQKMKEPPRPLNPEKLGEIGMALVM